jgi:peptide/nickel transport system ATP-binding protein
MSLGSVSDHFSAAAARGALVLEADALSKDFRIAGAVRSAALSAVRDVSFGLYRGSVVALVGESGSGKSTVARLLAGHERPTAGQIMLDGVEVHPSSRKTFRRYKRSVQMVFQDPFASLNAVHTVRYHLARPLRLHRGLDRNTIEPALVALLDEVRLTPAQDVLAKYPHELSGGQRQRVAIARALAASPRVLLADEPVSMLDVSIRLEVLDLLAALRDRLSLAVLYITHDIASARYFADETLVMYAGEIIERGPSEELTQHPAHPYTQLLVDSAPDPDAPRPTLTGWRGAKTPTSESALSINVGCRFAPRCPFADLRCRDEAPALLQIGALRAAACHHLDRAARALSTASPKERADVMGP